MRTFAPDRIIRKLLGMSLLFFPVLDGRVWKNYICVVGIVWLWAGYSIPPFSSRVFSLNDRPAVKSSSASIWVCAAGRHFFAVSDKHIFRRSNIKPINRNGFLTFLFQKSVDSASAVSARILGLSLRNHDTPEIFFLRDVGGNSQGLVAGIYRFSSLRASRTKPSGRASVLE